MENRWQIRLLGTLSLQSGAQTILRFRTHKTGALLAYLAYHQGCLHPREVLVDLLWPDASWEEGRLRLRVALSSLRHQLEPPGVARGTVLQTHRSAVGVNPAAIATDVQVFETAINDARRAGQGPERILVLQQAVGAYGGKLLPGYYEDWIEPEQRRLEGLFLEAAGDLVRALEGVEAWTQALDVAQRALRVDPLWEAGHRAVMQLQARLGHPDLAFRQYRLLKRRLQAEGESEPQEATRRQYQRIRDREENRPPDIEAEAARWTDRKAEHPTGTVLAQAGSEQTPLNAPTGTVTLLLADAGNGCGPQASADTLTPEGIRLTGILHECARRHGGYAFEIAPPPHILAFDRASEALACAVEGQRLPGYPLRMVLCTGEVSGSAEAASGSLMLRAVRMLGAGHPGQVLVSEETAGLLHPVLPAEIRLKGLGIYRLRDVDLPRRLYQVDSPPMGATDFPPLQAESEYPSHLPLRMTRYFGREAEIARLAAWVGREGARLVTLTGPAGSGKTRLALEVAQRLAQVFEGAVWFIPLADLSDPRLIADAMLAGMQLPKDAHREPLAQTMEALASHPNLLVLDNFEYLAAGGAGLVARLLAAGPALACLVTSRQPLHLEGERLYPVAPLPVPAGESPPETLCQNASVSLFVDRAQLVKPDFQVTNHNAPAVAQLCQRLEGIPLALELAAARVQAFTPEQMLQAMDQRLDWLRQSRWTGEARHRSLRAALEWSDQRLASELQRLWRRLSVFRGGWDLQAARFMGAISEIDEAISDLIASSLVQMEDTPQGIRYQMLESVREYGQAHLTLEERSALNAEHARYYTELAEQAEPGLKGAEQALWMARLQQEQGNLRAALAWSQRSAGGAAWGLRLAGALGWFWVYRGDWTEGRGWLEQLLNVPEGQAPTAERAKALSWVGHFAAWQGEHRLAQARLEESIGLHRARGDTAGLAWALYRLGFVKSVLGTAAHPCYQESRALFEAINDPDGLAQVLHDTGESDESLALYRRLENRNGMAWAQLGIGWRTAEHGDYSQGRRLMEESLAQFEALGDKGAVARTLLCLGSKGAEQGELRQAREQLERGLALFREVGNRGGAAFTVCTLGYVALQQGDDRRAQADLETALTDLQAQAYQGGISLAQFGLACVALGRGETVLARERLREAFAVMSVEWTHVFAGALACLAGILHAEGWPEQAACWYGAAAALREAEGVPMAPVEEARYRLQVASVQEALGASALANAWSQGSAMTTAEALARALTALSPDYDLAAASLPDALWVKIQPLLPPPQPKRAGRPASEARPVMRAILYVLRTGCPWKALPSRFGKASTVHALYQKWRRAGVFERMRQAGLLDVPINL
ncbi:MAG: transposase [Armatimonadetes bacterium]|nr:transposase [Armatimonadota bacterium]